MPKLSIVDLGEAIEAINPAPVRLSTDLKSALRTLTPREARFFVDTYYQRQSDRKRSYQRALAASKAGEPHGALVLLQAEDERMEGMVKRMLQTYAESHPVGQWSMSIVGIGPVISAGLLAHIDIAKAPTAGHIWRFAGLDPTVTWNKGEKRPWNTGLKTLTYHIGESFVKTQNLPGSVYGPLFAQRRAYEQGRSDRGELADIAAERASKVGKDTDAYKAYSQGQLPPAHLHARARRWTAKLFLAHWQEVAWQVEYGVPPSKPYVLEHLGHVHKIQVPNWPH